MLRQAIAVLLTTFLAGAVAAQDLDIRGVISHQIDAFRADDFATAFTFASPMIKGVFGTPERFGAMVQQGYPMVWRPADVQYLQQRQADGFTFQNVLIRDQGGTYFVLEYQMVATENGWQINGVKFLNPPAVGA